VTVRIIVFWDMAPYSLGSLCQTIWHGISEDSQPY